ncbi:MAG TPA: DUF302 domain-containing protein [Anaeromyxobacteraceae bacterium]|nr:DUF302 domain-containing protein [Anaeromyxobacteraceae bacterium]
MAQLGMVRETNLSYDDVLAKLPDLLKEEGFGVLTRIDVKATLKEKIGVDFRRYQILGACNPKFAHQALTIDPSVGVLLPCNVTVYERDGGGTTVRAIDPIQTMAGADARFAEVAGQVRERLARVIGRLG